MEEKMANFLNSIQALFVRNSTRSSGTQVTKMVERVTYIDVSDVAYLISPETSEKEGKLTTSSNSTTEADLLTYTFHCSTLDITILDVRDLDEWAEGHINGANHCPCEKWRNQDYVTQLREEYKDKDSIIVHCFKSQQRGPSSARI